MCVLLLVVVTVLWFVVGQDFVCWVDERRAVESGVHVGVRTGF